MPVYLNGAINQLTIDPDLLPESWTFTLTEQLPVKRGDSYFVHTAPVSWEGIQDSKWSVVTFKTEYETLEDAIVLEQTVLNTTVIMLMLGGFLAIFLGLKISGPIKTVSEAAVAIANGNLNAQVEIRSQDEVGILAQQFNRMVAKVNHQVETLETRVDQRTQSLRLAKEQAEQATRAKE